MLAQPPQEQGEHDEAEAVIYSKRRLGGNVRALRAVSVALGRLARRTFSSSLALKPSDPVIERARTLASERRRRTSRIFVTTRCDDRPTPPTRLSAIPPRQRAVPRAHANRRPFYFQTRSPSYLSACYKEMSVPAESARWCARLSSSF